MNCQKQANHGNINQRNIGLNDSEKSTKLDRNIKLDVKVTNLMNLEDRNHNGRAMFLGS